MADTVFDLWVRLITFLGASAAAIGGLTLTTWLSVIGVILAFLTLAVNWWYKRQILKIERERLEREFPTQREDK